MTWPTVKLYTNYDAIGAPRVGISHDAQVNRRKDSRIASGTSAPLSNFRPARERSHPTFRR
jgi:hypothetical protein